MSINKKQLFDQALHICEDADAEQMLNYIFDFFNISEVSAFLDHIKEEKGYQYEDEEDKY